MTTMVEKIDEIIQQAGHQGIKMNVMIYAGKAKVVAYKDTSGVPLGRIYARERYVDPNVPDFGADVLQAVEHIFQDMTEEQAEWLAANKEEEVIAEHIARNLEAAPATS